MTKKQALEKIAKEISECNLCKMGTIGIAVPGEGSEEAKVVFIGEAPGKKEAETGRPFVGRSGQLLRNRIQFLGLLENKVFITSVGKFLPTKKTLTSSQIKHTREHLYKQLEIIKPKVVVILGAVAAEGIFQEKISITSLHGTFRKRKGIYYFFTFHPAAVLRVLAFKNIFFEDYCKNNKLPKRLFPNSYLIRERFLCAIFRIIISMNTSLCKSLVRIKEYLLKQHIQYATITKL